MPYWGQQATYGHGQHCLYISPCLTSSKKVDKANTCKMIESFPSILELEECLWVFKLGESLIMTDGKQNKTKNNWNPSKPWKVFNNHIGKRKFWPCRITYKEWFSEWVSKLQLWGNNLRIEARAELGKFLNSGGRTEKKWLLPHTHLLHKKWSD